MLYRSRLEYVVPCRESPEPFGESRMGRCEAMSVDDLTSRVLSWNDSPMKQFATAVSVHVVNFNLAPDKLDEYIVIDVKENLHRLRCAQVCSSVFGSSGPIS